MYPAPEFFHKLDATHLHHWPSEVPEGQSGNAEIKKFEVTGFGAMAHNIRCTPGHEIVTGDYTKLLLDGKTMMSDTPKELMDHVELFNAAQGSVLVHGLGLGCATSVLCNMPSVEGITVVEINPHVIKLVGPTFDEHTATGRLEIIEGDAFTWDPPHMFDCVWSDIWFTLCEENLPQMQELEDKYRKLCGWHGFWSRDEVLEHVAMMDEAEEMMLRIAKASASRQTTTKKGKQYSE